MIATLAAQTDVAFGSDVTVACIVQGYPTPDVEWRLLGDILPPNSYTIGGNLTITGITFANTGTYRCTATNKFGTRNVTTTINVYGMQQK